MLMMDEQAWNGLLQLQAELAWLREQHPDKTALIGLAESHLQVIKMAGSSDSISSSGPNWDRSEIYSDHD